jgi:hypothetical protein
LDRQVFGKDTLQNLYTTSLDEDEAKRKEEENKLKCVPARIPKDECLSIRAQFVQTNQEQWIPQVRSPSFITNSAESSESHPKSLMK